MGELAAGTLLRTIVLKINKTAMLRTVALVLLGMSLVQAANVHLIDSNNNAYLKSGQAKISKNALSSLTAGLTGLLPAHEIDADTAKQARVLNIFI